MSNTHCPACGESWQQHSGIAATCVQLQEMTRKYHAALAKNEALRVENFRLRELARADERCGNGG